MRYMLLLSREQWEDVASPQQVASIRAQMGSWFVRLFSEQRLIEGRQLAGPETATTVVVSNGNTQVNEGPYSWSVEPVGGYAVLEVADLGQAIAIAKTFPSPHTKIEIRRILEQCPRAGATA